MYIGVDVKTGQEQVAVKLEHKKGSAAGQLGNESRLMQIFATNPHSSSTKPPPGFAELFYYGKEGSYAVLVMELLGATLEDVVAECKGKINPYSASVVAEQAIVALAYVHSKGIVHRDIKSENFMFGIGDKVHHLYIIDFGMSTRYYLKSHVKLAHGKQLTGTARYASINAMRGLTQSRRDDLEALGHMLVYSLRGSLPWSGLDAPTYKEKLKRICEVKDTFPLAELCQGFPNEFLGFLTYSRELQFEERPNYDQWVNAFRSYRQASNPDGQDSDLQWLEGQEIDRESLVPFHTGNPCALAPEESGMSMVHTSTARSGMSPTSSTTARQKE